VRRPWRRGPAGHDDDDARPPRPGFGLLRRALLAGVSIMLLCGGGVAGAVLLQVDEVINIVEREGRKPILIPEIDRAEAGKPQTLMILGSDIRAGDAEAGLKPRSDTIILVRLDPDKGATAVTSIPRDLQVQIPGFGIEKINAAFHYGGARLTLRTVKQLLSTTTRPFRINHVMSIDFGGFRRAIDYIGCVYVDVDRDYFNDNSAGQNYATIDIDPGYQKICGRDALDYVRYRHGDNDLVRSARQQDFLRQIRNQSGTQKLRDPRNIKTLARIFARYFEYDNALRDKQQLFALAKLVLFTSSKPVQEVQFRASETADHVNLTASPEQLAATMDEFLEARGSTTPRAAQQADPATEKTRRKGRRTTASKIPGLEEARTEGENQALLARRKVDFPFYFPTLRTTYGAFVGQTPRTYTIRDENGVRHDAYRMVVSYNPIQYYGIQGTTWRDPPILDDPSETVVRDGRRLRVFRDGKRVRLVAWRTKRAVYWVANTLTQSLSSRQMIGIAASLRRFST
jgi:LCP family protein required for cell wall assembly